MRAIRYIAIILTIVVLIVCGMLVRDYYRMDMGLATVYATTDDAPKLVQWLMKRKLFAITKCPSIEKFYPAGALGFLVNSMDSKNVDKEVIIQLFKHYQSVGCSINEANSVTGYRLIHAAILYKDKALVEFLIKNGADVSLDISEPSKRAGMSTVQWAKYVCSKSNTGCTELLEAIQ